MELLVRQQLAMLYFEDGGSWCVSKNTLVSETVGIQHMPKIELVTKPK